MERSASPVVPTSLERSPARHAANLCPVCHEVVAIGIQCSLCRRWFHNAPRTSQPGGPTSSGNVTPQPGAPRSPPANMSFNFTTAASLSRESTGRRSGLACVPVPFLMPFFCADCCYNAEVVFEKDEQRYRDAQALADSYLSPMAEDTDDHDGAASSVDSTVQSVLEGLREVARLRVMNRSERREVQEHWSLLFTSGLLRRIRRYLAQSPALPNCVLYTDERKREEAAAAGRDATRTMPRVEMVDGRLEVADASAVVRTGHDSETLHGHLDALQKESDLALRQQRRFWLGEPYDYANVGKKGRAADVTDGDANDRGSRAAPATTVRLSHVEIAVAESDDDGEETQPPY